MWRSFWFKTVRNVAVYGCVAVFLILVALCLDETEGNTNLNIYHKLVIWPFDFEYFIEIVIAAEASWLVINDLVSSTYKNAISSGISRKKYFISQVTCILLLITLELFVASEYYFSQITTGVQLSTIGSNEWESYILYILFIWMHHMAIAIISMSFSFIVRKLYVMLTVLFVLFAMMWLDALIKMRPELEMVVKILNHMPHAIARYLQKEAELQSITFGKSMVAILPTLAIAAVMLIISGILFSRGNLNE